MSCSDTHSQYIQNGIKYERPADAKYILQVDGDILLEEFEGFANIYKSKVVWRDDGYIVAVQHNQIGGSGISTVSLAFKESGPVLVTRMYVDATTETTSSFFSQCKKISR